jgi:hypothetical protein
MGCEALLRAQVDREPNFASRMRFQHYTRSKVKKRLLDKMLLAVPKCLD